jgi:REP element-mobilizing transposase RayT
LFGRIIDEDMRCNHAGRMVQTAWDQLPEQYRHVQTDLFIVMPNHIHAIVRLLPPDDEACGKGRLDYKQSAGGKSKTEQPPRGVAPADVVSSWPVGAGPRACPNDAGQFNAGEPATRKHGIEQSANAQVEPGQPRGVAPTNAHVGDKRERPPAGRRVLSLPDVVHRFKTLTTKRYIDGVRQYGWPAFAGRLWQRNYYEHIIRNEASLNQIRRYIAENPARWAHDPENPAGSTT